MRGLFKKLMISALALTMIFQMTGTVFAASIDWESGSYYYSAYLYSCMASAGLQTSNTVTFSAGRTIVIPAGMASGTYAVVQIFYGYTGIWGVLRSEDPNRPKTYVCSEQTFSFAPVSSEASPAFVKIE